MHMRQRIFWRIIERLVLTVELPAVFVVSVAAACWAFSSGRAAAGLLLLCLAAIPALLWASLPRQHRRHH